jgi:hypothetical protein
MRSPARRITGGAAALALGAAAALASPIQTPPDRPVSAASEEQTAKIEAAIKPYVEQARKTWPDAKKRFLAGLPKDYQFFVTARLHSEDGSFEQAFVVVDKIEKGKIYGRIASDVRALPNYHFNDKLTLPEEELLDWTIIDQFGSEEGNVVGKFLDTYSP